MNRQYSLISVLECVRREGDTHLAEERDLSRCGERFGKFQPLISGQEKRQASESVLVFYRLAKFLQSFESGENVLPFLEAYTRTSDGAYCLGFVRKYMSNNPMISRKDLSEYTGFLANF
ncbi:hypothetical protein D3C72_1927260 [compost metagenome]